MFSRFLFILFLLKNFIDRIGFCLGKTIYTKKGKIQLNENQWPNLVYIKEYKDKLTCTNLVGEFSIPFYPLNINQRLIFKDKRGKIIEKLQYPGTSFHIDNYTAILQQRVRTGLRFSYKEITSTNKWPIDDIL